MTAGITIAIDAMGGDRAPQMVIDGLAVARERAPDARFLIFGDEARVKPLVDRHPALIGISELRHTDEVVANEAKPSAALRSGRKSSMRLAIDSVRDGEARCVVSAGNTGALMAMAKVALKTLPGIDRPAIASVFPTMRGDIAMLDLGANVEVSARNLVQFAMMGAVFARLVLGMPRPTVGLLNVGAEELKGHSTLRDAAQILRDTHFHGEFIGFIEGDDLTSGTTDVAVTDGFTGNVALKTAEGTARLVTEMLRETFASSFLARIGYLFARGAFEKFRARTDPRRYNGAMFLGLSGVCVKSHGGTDALGFANAVSVGVDLVAQDFNQRIAEEMDLVTGIEPERTAAAG